MALLKSLIQRLLDSRTTPAQAAHSALRNTSSSTSIFTGEQIYTAPEDGFITVEGKSEANGGSAIGISSNGENYFLRTFQSVKDWGQAVTAPVSKGETVSISLYNLTDIEVKFYKSFGGGYNILVRRVLSCLRALSNCLPRSFCKAKSLGFQNNPLLSSIKALTSLAQAPRISLPTPHRATSGRLLGAIQLQSQLLKSKSRTGRWHLLPYLTETLRELESVVTLKKGHRLSSCVVAEVQPIILFGSTRQVQTFNPLTGGALC